MTAIAAVLALSSTSLMAQTVIAPAEPAPAASAPVVTPAPVAPTTSVAPAVTDPLAPALPPIAETVTTDKPEAASAPVKSKPVAKTSTTRTVKSASVAKGAPAVTRPVTSSASPEITKAAPVASTAVTTPLAVAPSATIAPTVTEAAPSQSTISTVQANEVLPIAGAAGAGLLALAGIGVAVRRRKRDDDEVIVEQEPVLETSHEQIVEPTFARSAIGVSPVVTRPVDDEEFHDDFDLSKYGPNVQAAYRGPTADNPSLSLRKRLKRGAALDQMVRNAGEAMPSAPRAMPIGPSDSFMLRPSSLQTSFRPVLQS